MTMSGVQVNHTFSVTMWVMLKTSQRGTFWLKVDANFVERKARNDGSGIPSHIYNFSHAGGSALNLNTWYFISYTASYTEEAGYTVLVYEGASLNGTKSCATCVPFHATPSSTTR